MVEFRDFKRVQNYGAGVYLVIDDEGLQKYWLYIYPLENGLTLIKKLKKLPSNPVISYQIIGTNVHVLLKYIRAKSLQAVYNSDAGICQKFIRHIILSGIRTLNEYSKSGLLLRTILPEDILVDENYNVHFYGGTENLKGIKCPLEKLTEFENLYIDMDYSIYTAPEVIFHANRLEYADIYSFAKSLLFILNSQSYNIDIDIIADLKGLMAMNPANRERVLQKYL